MSRRKRKANHFLLHLNATEEHCLYPFMGKLALKLLQISGISAQNHAKDRTGHETIPFIKIAIIFLHFRTVLAWKLHKTEFSPLTSKRSLVTTFNLNPKLEFNFVFFDVFLNSRIVLPWYAWMSVVSCSQSILTSISKQERTCWENGTLNLHFKPNF